MRMRKRSWSLATCVCALLLVAIVVWFNRRDPAPPGASALPSLRTAGAMRVAFEHARATVPASLTGTVRSGDRGVSGALVCAACAGCEAIGARASACVRSAGNGRYEFATLAPGSYYVHASADGYAPASALGGKALTIVGSEARADLDIALERGGGQLTGTVLDATGGPV
ncbi:MAG TPA: carboxypeptidase-like regulatory domain-containing protein, partial [Polyangiales bacterium]|nr:carboxypeptidase-like regulatory domain-containing protein [Polyangiales bacterium]